MFSAFHVHLAASGRELCDIDSLIQSHEVTCQKIGKSWHDKNKLGCVVRMVVDSILPNAGQMTMGKTHPRLYR